MLQALRDRIAYERSYSIRERIERRKDKIALGIARLLPQRLVNWVIVRRHAELTSGAHGNVHPDSLKAFDLYRPAA